MGAPFEGMTEAKPHILWQVSLGDPWTVPGSGRRRDTEGSRPCFSLLE